MRKGSDTMKTLLEKNIQLEQKIKILDIEHQKYILGLIDGALLHVMNKPTFSYENVAITTSKREEPQIAVHKNK